LEKSEDILVVERLKKYFKTSFGVVKAVDDISFNVRYGEIFALVGESGSGKSTTGFTIAGVYVPTSGKIIYKGEDITMHVKKRPMRLKRDIQMVFQDPGSSLNPRMVVRDVVGLPLMVHEKIRDKAVLEERVAELLKMVGLPPEDFMYRFPRELGGGEKQLVAIARALATRPSFVILDESTSALDVSMQAIVLRTLLRIQRELNLSYLLITHDLGVVRNVASRVAIMYLGKIYEIGPTVDFFQKPLHPYTQMLLSAIPVMSDEEEKLKPKGIKSVGEIPSAINPPPGCRFHTRCPYATDVCKTKEPEFIEVGRGHWVACHMCSKA